MGGQTRIGKIFDMPRPLKNPGQRERERAVAGEIYELLFPGTSVGLHRNKPLFYLKVEGKHYRIEVKEVQTPNG